MALFDVLKKHSLIIGMAAMVLLVVGTFSEGGSLLQKVLFVIGTPVLGIPAYFNKQKMFMTLQTIASIGAVLGFFPYVFYLIKYLIMLGVAVIGIGYLIKIKYYKADKWWLIGCIGLLCFAYAFATNPVTNPILFNSLIVIGAILVAIYSAIGFFLEKVKIAVIWLILNLLMCINPLIIIFSQILK